MRQRLGRSRLATAVVAMLALGTGAAVVPLAVPAASDDEVRTITAQIVNQTKDHMTVYANVSNGKITYQTGNTPFHLEPGKTFDYETSGPEYSPCLFDDAETCLENTFLVDFGDTTGSPTTGFNKAARNIDIDKDARIPGKEGAGGNRLRLGNGDYEFTFDVWNPRGEANQDCFDNLQNYEVDDDDAGIAVLDYSVTWTISFEPGTPASDGC